MEKELKRTVRLDEPTDKLLTQLARRFEGNASMAVREALRSEAARAGLIAQDRDRAAYGAPGR